jgi:hypothetical protein
MDVNHENALIYSYNWVEIHNVLLDLDAIYDK